MKRIAKFFLYLFIYSIIFVCVIAGFGLFGVAFGLIGAALAFSSPEFREWLLSQRGFIARLSKLPGLKSQSKQTLTIAILGYTLPISVVSWFFISGSFSDSSTFIVVGVMALIGISLLYGWFIYGWRVEGVDAPTVKANVSISNTTSFLKQNKIIAAVLGLAALFPFICGGLGSALMSSVTPTPVSAAITNSLVGTDSSIENTVTPIPEVKATETITLITLPTDTPIPLTATSVPTNTPDPTDTPVPTNTPRPSNTPAPEPLVEINASSVNLRGGPGTNYESIGILESGNVVKVIAQTDDGSWYNVELDNGSLGWIGASITTPVVASSLANIPVAATIPSPPVVAEAPPPTSPPAQPTDEPVSTEPTAVPVPTNPPPASAAQVVIINVNKRDEYVDIQNTGGTDQDLGGWVLVSEKGNQTCGLGGVLPAGGTLRIWAMSEDAGQGGFNCGYGGPIWNNSNPDAAILLDSNGAVVSRY